MASLESVDKGAKNAMKKSDLKFKKKDEDKIQVFVIDGNNFDDIGSFYNECETVFGIKKGSWGRNLDAFNDVLRGGFGNIPSNNGNYILVWKNSKRSKKGFYLFDKVVSVITSQKSGHDKVQLKFE